MAGKKINVYERPVRKTKQETDTSEKREGDYTERGVIDLRRGLT